MLRQRSVHHSAHDNGIETLVAGTPAKLEGLHPHAPALSGERLVYPQVEDE
ncbi:hypothetical protein KUV59_07410 [Marinobacter daepoensis]|uniref:hypothetical protein n=1 Tax=Marinobacter daepoensis TaxID=262077 RepID=UPI001C98A775|nr:hypothetical protein [Marinobacter daepoensis]MBY6032990.1 hypothetical protein [Marinobacter daepoensis]